MDIPYKDAITRVGAELQADPQLFYAFQANIAMPIYDALIDADIIKPDKFEAVHAAVNQGAKAFLSLLGDLNALPATTALERISQERWKQLYRYGFDVMHDDYADGELVQAALFSIDPDGDFDHLWPTGWDNDARQRIVDRNQIDRLTVAASLLAAQVDRLLFEHRIQSGPRTLDQCINRYLHRFRHFQPFILDQGEDYFVGFCQSQQNGGFGMQIRNELGLWVHESPLHQYFLAEHRLHDADAMSSLILRGIYQQLTKPRQQFEFEGSNYITTVIDAPSMADAIRYFKRDFPGAQIDVIDGRERVGTCVYSGLPIFDDDDYICDTEGEYWLKAHGPTDDELAAEAAQNDDDHE